MPNALAEVFCDPLGNGGQRLIESRGIGAARLGEIRPAAAFPADLLRHRFNQVARPNFVDIVLRDPCRQMDFVPIR